MNEILLKYISPEDVELLNAFELDFKHPNRSGVFTIAKNLGISCPKSIIPRIELIKSILNENSDEILKSFHEKRKYEKRRKSYLLT